MTASWGPPPQGVPGEEGPTTWNQVVGGIQYAVVQGQSVTVTLPPRIEPHLTGLPPLEETFTGRDDELEGLLAALNPDREQPEARTVSAVAGLPGVGKTELVLHAARQALRTDGWFPGGVLFVDLAGYDDERRVTPEKALDGFLRALGLPVEHIPHDLQDLRRHYTSVLAAYAAQGRRILVVIDNAASAAQVEPLLPGDGLTAVLVTSRHTLAGL
ncbi:ATP-binding protein, partial [Kitasatospora sp. NPDC093558]|uniref:ATP-binding protein n=1 Tax=Kitasatospora sp. NPDC093558 TaxID=3155201 RepID=UPI003440AA97